MSYIINESRSMSRSDTIYASYCCSACANPVVTRLTIKSTQSGRTGLFGVKDSELSEQVSSEQAANMARLLEYLTRPNAQCTPAGEISGLNSPCPVCGHVEPWQTQEPFWTADAENPILLFPRLKLGYAWAQQVLLDRKAAAELAASDPDRQRQGEARLRAIDDELRVISEGKNNGPAAQEFAALREKEKALADQLQATSAFSRDKKQTKEALDQCRAELDRARTRFLTATAYANAKTAKLLSEKAPLLLFGKALTNRAVLHENECSLALTLDTDGEDNNRRVSLAALPETDRFTASAHETDPMIRPSVERLAKTLNEARLARQAEKGGE